MFEIDPAWGGSVQFYELLYGSWLAYAFLVLMWERALKSPLPEWKYLLVLVMGANAFLINHYFQHAPLWNWALNVYTLSFLVVYYWVCVRPQARSVGWKVMAGLSAVLFTVAYIAFENIARYFVDNLGYSEFWFSLTAFIGFYALLLWRGALRGQP